MFFYFLMKGILNAICGDIIGSTHEFGFGRTKDYNFPLFDQFQRFTDDTVHTIAVADWLMHTDRTGIELVKKLKSWSMRYNYGFGHLFNQWLFSANKEPYNSYGNGSAMRVSPVGYIATSLEECLELATVSAAVTHNHPEGIKGAQAIASAIYLNRQGKSKEEIKEFIINTFNYDLNRSYDDIKKIYKFDATCQGSVPESIICWLESIDYIDCIRKAVSLGGDADTVACIAGSICGANDQTAIENETVKTIYDKGVFNNAQDIVNIIDEFNNLYS